MITITPSAKEKMLTILHQNPGKKFRLSVTGLMCGGEPMLEIALDEKKEDDEIIYVGDMGILLSPDDTAFVDHAVIDYDNSASDPGLFIR